MENPAYYRDPTVPPPGWSGRLTVVACWLSLTVVVMGGTATAAWPAQTPAEVAAPACDDLRRDPLPVLTDSEENSTRLSACGYALTHEGAYQRAARVFAAALDMARRRADRSAIARALDGYGLTLGTLGDANRAEPLLQESLTISAELDDQDGMAEASSQLGHLRTMQARYDEARAFHLRSLELWQAIDDGHGVAVALNNIGASYRATGDYLTAGEYYQRSLDGLQQIGDRRRSATVIDNLGRIARSLGDYAKGLDLAREALAIRESFNDREGIGRSLTSLSEVYRAQGNYGAALAALRRGLDLFRAVGAAHSVAETLNNIAVVFEAQGNYGQAARYLRQSLALNDAKVRSGSLTAEIRTHLGEVFFAEGANADAIRSLKRSLVLCAASGFEPQAADARLVLARVYARTGRLFLAADTLQTVLAFRTTSGDSRGRADALIELADVELARNNLAHALALATEARDLTSAMELHEVGWLAMTTVGRVELALGRLQDARAAFDAAIAVVEDMRLHSGGGEETRSRFFSDRLAPYQARIALALAGSHIADAFHVAEQSKARVLLDVIRGDRLPITNTMSDEERQREISLRTALTSVNRELQVAAQTVPRNEPRLDALRRKRESRRLEYEDFQARLYEGHPSLRVSRAAVPIVSATEAQQLAGPDTAIVEFAVAHDRIHAFVITGTGICSFTLAIRPAALALKVRTFRKMVATRDLRASDSARDLHALVLGPMQAALEGKTSVVVVPDGMMWDLPFQALQSPTGRYLIEDKAISYAPSVTVWRETMRAHAAGTGAANILALANPGSGANALPETATEVTQLSRAYGTSRIVVGREAREDRWKAQAPDYRVLHLATHGVVDNASPLYSHLVLAPPEPGDRDDGLLEGWEIMRLSLRAELVILSACDTARGRVAPGEGVIGLMWALFVAGSPATLLSEWQVESASTTALMVAFHREWAAGQRGVSKARALQLAAVRVLRTKSFAHPFYWAGFVLAGDGR
jgi:CHAT domain-containing protein/tetratricopeptide (TPR) repeat protein